MGRVYARHVLRFLFIVALLGTWFMPLIVAALYKLPHQGPIAVLSLALGWTGVGWLAALVIAVGGAIRATRPALAGQAQPEGMPALAGQAPPEGMPAPGAYAAAMPKAPAQSAWPGAAATAPERAQGPEAPERAQSPQWPQTPERAQSPQWPQSPESPQRAQPPERTQGPPPSWPDNPS
jgi:Superinfection immunity protein